MRQKTVDFLALVGFTLGMGVAVTCVLYAVLWVTDLLIPDREIAGYIAFIILAAMALGGIAFGIEKME